MSRRALFRALCRAGLRCAGRSGFSVVEMLLVFAIVGIAILPLASVQFYSRREVNEAQHHSQAIQLAEAQLEQMRASGFGQAQPDTVRNGIFTTASSVVQVSNTLQQLQVTVSWQHGTIPRAMTLTCLQSLR
jgi:Tfp pilus assembly protein PilV